MSEMPISNMDIPIPIATNTAPTDIFKVSVGNMLSTDTTNSSMAYLFVIEDDGRTLDIGWKTITPGKQEINIYNTLNSAYLGNRTVRVGINSDKITSVWFV